MKQMFALTIFLALISCTKQEIPIPTCDRVYWLSDKYRADSVFIQTDTLWPWGRLNNVFCGEELAMFRNIPDTVFPCIVPNPLIPNMKLEGWRWIVGNEKSAYRKLK